MKKILKYTGLSLAMLVILVISIVCIAGLIIPEQQEISCSKEMSAPPYIIYSVLSDYNQWSSWDPWTKLDSNQSRVISGVAGTVGHNYSWCGNDKVGKGRMIITKIEKNNAIAMRLEFLEPWETQADVDFTIVEKNGQSAVTWTMKMKYPFLFRLMGKLMQKYLLNDFNEGLAKLKIVSEKKATDHPTTLISKPYEVREMELVDKNYVLLKSMHQSIAGLSEFFNKEMPKAFAMIESKQMELDGAPSGFYYTFDDKSGFTDVAIAFVVKKISPVTKPYETYRLKACKAVFIDYYGEYNQMESAYSTLYEYLEQNNLEQNGPAIEEYIGDPAQVNGDMSKCLTKIIIPIQ